MLLGGAVNAERERERPSWSMRQRAAEWEGEHMDGMADGRWSSISIKGTEILVFNTIVRLYNRRYRDPIAIEILRFRMEI